MVPTNMTTTGYSLIFKTMIVVNIIPVVISKEREINAIESQSRLQLNIVFKMWGLLLSGAIIQKDPKMGV